MSNWKPPESTAEEIAIAADLKIRLLACPAFSYWAGWPKLFDVFSVEPGVLDVKVSRTPDGPITLTGHAIHSEVPFEFNRDNTEFQLTGAYVTSGSPEGGTLRILYQHQAATSTSSNLSASAP